MLETDYLEQIETLLQTLEHKLNAPSASGDFYQKSGILPSIEGDKRRFARKFLRAEALVRVLPTFPSIARSGESERIVIMDVSRSGIGFLNYRQLFPGENLELMTHVGKFNAIVRRCTKLCTKRYEIGAEFD